MLDQLLDAPAHGVSLDRLDRQGLDNGLDSATTRASTAVDSCSVFSSRQPGLATLCAPWLLVRGGEFPLIEDLRLQV